MPHENIFPVSNDGKANISEPYLVSITIEGTSALLFHKWSNEDVEAKSNALKNSQSKKLDNLEAYVYRNQEHELCIPGEYVRQSIIGAAKYRPDPRSPRKSAQDLFKAGIIAETELSSLGIEEWDFLDKRRVTIQRSCITRTRPAMMPGWRASFVFNIIVPEYITSHLLYDTVIQAGRLIGIGDFRPTYGRFAVVSYELC